MAEERYLSPEQTAEIYNLKVRTVRTWCLRGFIKAGKLGRQWRIPESELRKLFKDHED